MFVSRARAGVYPRQRARALGRREEKKKKTIPANALSCETHSCGPAGRARATGSTQLTRRTAPEEGAARLRLALEQARVKRVRRWEPVWRPGSDDPNGPPRPPDAQN